MRRYTYPAAMRRLINELSKLPSIGEKSASRLAYHLLISENNQAQQLAQTLIEAKQTIRFCERCFSLSETELCEVCTDPERDSSLICVVEKPVDVVVIERSGGYRGLYHVIHGLWSPLKGIGPEKTKIPQLMSRVRATRADGASVIEEIVLATGTTVEGDATALYIADAVGRLGVKVSRIAQGLPKGGELEYADEITLSHALLGRSKME